MAAKSSPGYATALATFAVTLSALVAALWVVALVVDPPFSDEPPERQEEKQSRALAEACLADRLARPQAGFKDPRLPLRDFASDGGYDYWCRAESEDGKPVEVMIRVESRSGRLEVISFDIKPASDP